MWFIRTKDGDNDGSPAKRACPINQIGSTEAVGRLLTLPCRGAQIKIHTKNRSKGSPFTCFLVLENRKFYTETGQRNPKYEYWKYILFKWVYVSQLCTYFIYLFIRA